jgi:DMSO/TMAO reductase YedYZ molybdopterin-dependent catalytic subunit/thiosulfate reductase cytochrome b subunit
MWIRRRELVIAAAVLTLPVLLAWIQAVGWGAGTLPDMSERVIRSGVEPIGFPIWLRVTHYVNLILLVLLVRSGLQILVDHPRLYWNVHCTPGTEWLRLTPVKVPTDRLWTAKDDARYLSGWVGLPGGRHTVGLARHWHFLSVLAWLGNGLLFVGLLFGTGQWRRLVPTSWAIVPEAWTVFVHYVTLRLPPEPDGFYAYNPLQQLAYFGVVFVLAPLSMLTGAAMSPALTNAHPWYPRLFGNRQIARSVHFLLLCGYLGFLVPHVGMVALTGLARNMNHIVLGTDDTHRLGLALGGLGLTIVPVVCILAHIVTWRYPRLLQHFSRATVGRVMGLAFDRMLPRAEYPREAISPYLWPNGKLPTGEDWTRIESDGFRDYRLRVVGLVECPVELSMDEIRALPRRSHTTLHNCVQGWSGIAQWAGLPLAVLIDRVRPRAEARYVVFNSYGEGGEGGAYYDVHALEDLAHPQSLLAYEMNGAPLTVLHGAPLRLRVENQLGYKQVKWIRSIEFVASYRRVSQGEGGYNEDHEFYGCKAEI